MKRRIFWSIVTLILPGALLLSAAVSLAFYILLSDSAETVGGLVGIFAASLPVVFLFAVPALLLANHVAGKLTLEIIKTLSRIDFKSENEAAYDELYPYVRKLDRQKRENDERCAALAGRAETIEAIVESLKEGLILIDANGLALAANKSARDIFSGIERENILHICREPELQEKVQQCLTGESTELLLLRNGKTYSVFLSPVYNGEAADGAALLFLDMTEKLKSEKQRREFSANVSHELKTPLTTISALSEMIAHGMAHESDIKIFASRISEQAGRLINIIEDIIRLSEFDEGGVHKEYSEFDLYKLAESTIDSLKDNAKNVKVKLDGERFDITANYRMFDELLYNLVENGIKYNKDGGLVTVSLSRADDLFQISVSDTGIGIPEKHLPWIFERFYRVEKSRSKKTGGTGLGLSIVKHITEHHGGHVEMESVQGAGTTVHCIFFKRVI